MQKQIPIPEPALEVGVPQYPTPLVPSFGPSPTGHIVLVVKKSVKKGSYNPQPVDGSVTYTGRDAGKWPSTLYLVYEKQEETGLYVFQYYANDRTLSSQNAWNSSIGYSSENPAYPIMERIYVMRRSAYGTGGFPPFALGSVDPVVGGTAIVAKQEKKELPDENPLRSLYVAVQVTYETIPGPVISGAIAEEYGPATISKKIVVAGTGLTSPSTETLVDKVEPLDAVKSGQETLILTDNNMLTGYNYDADLGANITTTRQLIAAGTAAYSTVHGDLSYRDDPKNYWQTIRTIAFITGRPAPPISPRTEYYTGAYSSPNLITGFTMSSFAFTAGSQIGDVQLTITPVMRAARSFNTSFMLEQTYSYGQPTQPTPTIFDPLAINVFFDGFFIKVNIPNCLVNPGFVLTFNTASDNPVYGYVYETFDVPSTDVTATGYNALIGTYQIISYDVKYWKANIWTTTIRSVLIK
jgi:hypothetical protein